MYLVWLHMTNKISPRQRTQVQLSLWDEKLNAISTVSVIYSIQVSIKKSLYLSGKIDRHPRPSGYNDSTNIFMLTAAFYTELVMKSYEWAVVFFICFCSTCFTVCSNTYTHRIFLYSSDLQCRITSHSYLVLLIWMWTIF